MTGTLAAGYFGGGINGGMGNFSFREDYDIQLLWTLQNFGLGNRPLIRQRSAENRAALTELSAFRTEWPRRSFKLIPAADGRTASARRRRS